MQAGILKQSESLHEVLEMRCLCNICLVEISWCVSEVNNSIFQILKLLKLSSWAKLESLVVKLVEVYLSFWLLESCLHFKKIAKQSFNV